MTLFAVTPDVIKDVVYTMRFDEGSALYGEFGRFYVGYVATIDDLVERHDPGERSVARRARSLISRRRHRLVDAVLVEAEHRTGPSSGSPSADRTDVPPGPS